MAVKVVLFEDTIESRDKILAALKKHVAGHGEALPFDHLLFKETAADQDRMYEDRLVKILSANPYEGTTLIVADRDLSKTVEGKFTGLSVSSVAAAARRLSIPVCSYARGVEVDDYDWKGRWEEGHIVLHLAEGEDELGRRAILAANGFSQIEAALPSLERPELNSPAKLLSELLGKPEYRDKIALYAVGDQNRLPHIPNIPREGKQAADRGKRLALLLGFWLWDSLLRYPGIFVNEVAAASYLNIRTEDFRVAEVQALFQNALYAGPFADTKRAQWWRGALDDLLAASDCDDGLDFVQKRGFSGLRRSECYVDPNKSAGYYCIIKKLPVSLENSKGGLSWFPRGADLTRIGNPTFEEYGPWLGT